MNEHPQIAKKYERLKLKLWKRFEHNRDAYFILEGFIMLSKKLKSIIL